MKIANNPLITLVLCLFLVPAHAIAGMSFHWVDDEDYPPLIYRNEKGKPAGIFHGIMTEAFQRMEIPLKAEVYPWSRSQQMVREGLADGMVTVLTEERKKFVRPSDPLLLIAERIFANRHNPRIDEIMSIGSIQQLKPYRIVEIIGSGWTKEKLKGFDVTWVPAIKNAYLMLAKGRADIFIANAYTWAGFRKRNPGLNQDQAATRENIISSKHPLKTLAFRLLIRKDSPFVGILDRFNNTINQMKMDGTIDRIIAQESHYESD